MTHSTLSVHGHQHHINMLQVILLLMRATAGHACQVRHCVLQDACMIWLQDVPFKLNCVFNSDDPQPHSCVLATCTAAECRGSRASLAQVELLAHQCCFASAEQMKDTCLAAAVVGVCHSVLRHQASIARHWQCARVRMVLMCYGTRLVQVHDCMCM